MNNKYYVIWHTRNKVILLLSKFICNLFLNFRDSMHCTIYCLNNPSCNAILWDKSKRECLEMEMDSLICDEDKIDTIKVLVDVRNIPPTCRGTSKYISFSWKSRAL